MAGKIAPLGERSMVPTLPRGHRVSCGQTGRRSTAVVENVPRLQGLEKQSLNHVKHVGYLILYIGGVISLK